MTRLRKTGGMLLLIYQAFLILVLLSGLFLRVWLRANVVTVSYDLRKLEEQKTRLLKDAKLLHAEKAKSMSVDKLGVAFHSPSAGQNMSADGLVFPDRVRVIHIRKAGQGPEPHRAAYGSKRSLSD